jgi:alkylated DNA repair dioxygenase AlkB
LSAADPQPPEGFRYQPELLRFDEERDLVERIERLPLAPFEFHGYLASRRVVSYGWSYSYDARSLHPAGELPAFLLPLRERAAAFAGLEPERLAQALITEYRPGAAIGWHRDKSVFGDVIGISLHGSCVLRFRRKAGATWVRYSLTAEPRSAYVLCGAVRTAWEHSIPAVTALRYSITFRTLR